MEVYHRTASVFDLQVAAQGRDYAAQAEQHALTIRNRCPGAATLLDVACGTGGHLVHLQRDFTVTGVDISPAMLERAAQRLPGLELHLGDMRSFRIDRGFDAVLCLFQGIGYMLTIEDLRMAIANMARHLNRGGVLIIEPWIPRQDWRDDYPIAGAANEPGRAISWVNLLNRSEGHVSTFDLHWMIATGDRIDTFVEHHRMGLYTPNAYRDAMASAGLIVEHDPGGPLGGLFIGVAP